MVETIRSEVEGFGAKVEIKVDNLCRAVDIPEDSKTVEISKKALKTVGIEAETTFITGFTDASIYNNHGIEVAVAVVQPGTGVTQPGTSVSRAGTGVGGKTGVVVPRKTVWVGRGVLVCAAQ